MIPDFQTRKLTLIAQNWLYTLNGMLDISLMMLICFLRRFCSECKSKVLKAYNILTGDIDGDTEKG